MLRQSKRTGGYERMTHKFTVARDNGTCCWRLKRFFVRQDGRRWALSRTDWFFQANASKRMSSQAFC